MNIDGKKAFNLIIIFGLISLLGDVIYEGARSIYGPYTKTLNVNIATVGVIIGVSEFLGYLIRLASGYFSDKAKAQWILTIVGYGMLISIPLLSLVGTWQIATIFIIFERIGKAVRSPAKDTILSQVTKKVGTGFGFALHELLDQIGAMIGPLIFTAVLFISNNKAAKISDYQRAFSILWIPFIILMILLFYTYSKIPNPELIVSEKSNSNKIILSKKFWLYSAFTFFTSIGFLGFVFISYSLKERNIMNDSYIPLMYTLAMGVDGVFALIIGKFYDKFKYKEKNELAGIKTIILIPIITIFIPLLAFSSIKLLIILSIILWGIVMGTHETIMKSAIADLTYFKKRGLGYGIFNMIYGVAILIGSIIFGFLYTNSTIILFCFVLITQLVAILIYTKLKKDLYTD